MARHQRIWLHKQSQEVESGGVEELKLLVQSLQTETALYDGVNEVECDSGLATDFGTRIPLDADSPTSHCRKNNMEEMRSPDSSMLLHWFGPSSGIEGLKSVLLIY